jgi:hypothetical protein
MLWLQNELAARSARPIKALPEINEKQNNAMHSDGIFAALYSRQGWPGTLTKYEFKGEKPKIDIN